MAMTKTELLDAYRQTLINTYDWAKNEVRLDRYMHSVAGALRCGTTSWATHGDALIATWHKLGGKGKPTLAKLRALPN